jgi:hypothetical protein
MRKILLTILFLTLCSTAHATVWFACTSGGNWSANVWTSVSADQGTCLAALGTPVAGDTATLNSSSGNITITAAAAAAFIDETGYVGTLAFGTQTLTLTTGGNIGGAMTSSAGGTIVNSGGTITLLSTPTGSFPLMSITGSQTLTPGGFNWSGTMNTVGAVTITITGNWLTNGLTTFGNSAVIINGAFNFGSGGFTQGTAGVSGTSTLVLHTGTWSSSGNSTNFISNNFVIGAGGTVTLSGNLWIGGDTITYTSGTIVNTGSQLELVGNVTLNTSGMTWNNVNTNQTYSSETITLTSAFNANNLLLNATITMAGNYNMTFGTLTNGYGGAIFNMLAGTTMTVSTLININSQLNMRSETASSPVYLTYNGTAGNAYIASTTFTDVTANTQLFDFGYNLTLTRTTDIKLAGPGNLFHGQGYAY